jgi:hypothetical protein
VVRHRHERCDSGARHVWLPPSPDFVAKPLLPAFSQGTLMWASPLADTAHRATIDRALTQALESNATSFRVLVTAHRRQPALGCSARWNFNPHASKCHVASARYRRRSDRSRNTHATGGRIATWKSFLPTRWFRVVE